MHRATKKSGLTKSADGSIARRTRSCCARPGGGRHVCLDKKCLLMEVRYPFVTNVSKFCELRIQHPAYRSFPEALMAALRASEASSYTCWRVKRACQAWPQQASERPPHGSQEVLTCLRVPQVCNCCPSGGPATRRLCDEPPYPPPSSSSLLYA
jgi:hypothetical protein